MTRSTAKRPAAPEAGREPEAKRAREPSAPQDVLDLLPHPPSAAGELPAWFDHLERALREAPFGQPPGAREWGIKRRAYALLEPVLAAFRPDEGELSADTMWAAARAVDQLILSGYAATARDRRALVAAGAWRPALALALSTLRPPDEHGAEATGGVKFTDVDGDVIELAVEDDRVVEYLNGELEIHSMGDFKIDKEKRQYNDDTGHGSFKKDEDLELLDKRVKAIFADQKAKKERKERSDKVPRELEMAVNVYVHLAEHASFYEDFTGFHAEFWSPAAFLPVLEALPWIVAARGDLSEADEWEAFCPDLEAALKTLGRFLGFWTKAGGNEPGCFDISRAMPLLWTCTAAFERHDRWHGHEVSAKVRGDFLEEVVRVAGGISTMIVSVLEEGNPSAQKRARYAAHAKALLEFLVQILMLRVPTFGPRAEVHSGPPGSGMLPLDERQMDTDWFEGLWEHCSATDADGDAVQPDTLIPLFREMVGMPTEEQKYRLECVAPLVPPFISRFADMLKEKEIPRELADLKEVMNTVLQDDSFVNSDFMEEISFYPCLLEFATKRATIHAVCDRVKLQQNSEDPIRLVVPRDNVLDGVCSSLNLQDHNAHIDVPVEIEFKTGLVDSAGQELMDEGEDQGGLRRQWLDRASRHFISSDLFRSPSSSSSSTASANAGGTADQQLRGSVFVPSPESVCRHVQDDWEEQFELFGCILGFALLHKDTVPVHFGHNFLRAVFGMKTGPQDLLPLLESVDKTLHTKVKYVLDGSYRGIGDSLKDVLEQAGLPRVFAVDESHCAGLVHDTMLKESGDQIAVTEENKEEFVERFLDRLLISGLRRQVECFRRGLLRVVPEEVVLRIGELMTLKEIEVMVCGADEVDVDDWQEHTRYENGYTKDSRPVQWFWDVVRSMTQASRAALLSFATGSPQVPSGGFRFLQPELFTVQRVAVTDRYPEAHTCANTVDLPEYTSREELERRLLFAISETGDAFGRR